jgi:hypothetical protein
MKLHFDEKASAIYLRLEDSKIIESQESNPALCLTATTTTKLWAMKVWTCEIEACALISSVVCW